MLKLRTFRDSDAQIIVGWIKDEQALRRWSADRYGDYPICAEDICDQYAGHEHSNVLFPLTLEEEGRVVGHMILRFPGPDRKTIRFGFIIVDDSIRGRGYGKKLLQLAIRQAKEIFCADTITLGVFENNPPAYYCYKSVGFQDVPMEKEEYYHVLGEDWKCLEMAMEV